jgi:transcriptional regulator with XRE-family HTH domain
VKKSIYSDRQKVLQTTLRELRLEKGFRQKDLADLLNEPQSFVSKYESGERRLDFFELWDICNSLSISVPDFIRRIERVLNETE